MNVKIEQFAGEFCEAKPSEVPVIAESSKNLSRLLAFQLVETPNYLGSSWFESRWSLNLFQASFFPIFKICSPPARIIDLLAEKKIITKLWLVFVLHLTGWQAGVNLLDKSLCTIAQYQMQSGFSDTQLKICIDTHKLICLSTSIIFGLIMYVSRL